MYIYTYSKSRNLIKFNLVPSATLKAAVTPLEFIGNFRVL